MASTTPQSASFISSGSYDAAVYLGHVTPIFDSVNVSVLRYAIELAQAAGDIALRHFRDRDALVIERKDALDLVSIADREVERHIRDEIELRFPDDGFLGEETDRTTALRGRRTWVVDPIDGTLNFLRGHDAWAVTIALIEAGRPRLGVIHAPVRKETLSGGEGLGARLNGEQLPLVPSTIPRDAIASIGVGPRVPLEQQLSLIRFIVGESGMTFRRNGCASVSLMMLVKQDLDAMFALGLRSWDVAAGVAIAHEIGYASNFTVDEAALARPLDLVCASQPLFEHLRQWDGFRGDAHRLP